jgi:hypothetical protein
MFNVGDLIKLNYSEHIGIVIKKSELGKANIAPVYSYHIKWAVGEPFTWEIARNLILVAGVNSAKCI